MLARFSNALIRVQLLAEPEIVSMGTMTLFGQEEKNSKKAQQCLEMFLLTPLTTQIFEFDYEKRVGGSVKLRIFNRSVRAERT